MQINDVHILEDPFSNKAAYNIRLISLTKYYYSYLELVHDEPTTIETFDLAMKHSENQPKATPSFTYGLREEDIRSKAGNLLSKTPETIGKPKF